MEAVDVNVTHNMWASTRHMAYLDAKKLGKRQSFLLAFSLHKKWLHFGNYSSHLSREQGASQANCLP